MISCEKENLKNLILDMANRLHSDVALTYARWAGMSPTAHMLPLPSITAFGPGDAKQLGFQLSPTSSFLPFNQVLPAAGAAPHRDTMHSPMPEQGSFSPSASCPGNTASCMASHFRCCLVMLSHTFNLTKCMLKSVRNSFWPLIPFSDGFGTVLLGPKHVLESILPPWHPQRSVGSLAVCLLAQYGEIKAAAPGLALYSVWDKDQEQWDQPCPPSGRLSTCWLHENCQGEGINNMTEEQEALVNDCCSP